MFLTLSLLISRITFRCNNSISYKLLKYTFYNFKQYNKCAKNNVLYNLYTFFNIDNILDN